MLGWCCWTLVTTFILFACNADKYSNERATIIYANPNYFTNAKAYTARTQRKDVYKSNITGTILQPWGNNVTFEMVYMLQSTKFPIKLGMPVCDFMKVKWAMEFLIKYTDVNPKLCPLPAGTYFFKNVIFPPKGFPLPISRGRNLFNVTIYLTNTTECMAIIGCILNAS